jgi:hypothetical protein
MLAEVVMALILVSLLYIDAAVAALALLPGLALADGAATCLHIAVSAANVAILSAVLRSGSSAAALVFAATLVIEAAQLFIPGRTGCWEDVCANAIGVAIGLMLATLLFPEPRGTVRGPMFRGVAPDRR